MTRCAFIGTGVMGEPMAQNLLRGGFGLSVYDLDSARLDSLVTNGARRGESVADTLQDAEVVLTSLPSAPQIEALAFADDGIFANLNPGAVWIDLSTSEPELGVRMHGHAKQIGVDILDAPVTGGDEGARAGTLSILVGGEEAVFARMRPLLECIGERVLLVGKNGAGYGAKISQVLLCYLHSLALSEALQLGIKSGVAPAAMLDIIQHSTGRSYVSARYGPAMLDGSYDPSFTLGLSLKDIKLAMTLARKLGIQLPMCALSEATYARAVEKYGADANHLMAVRLLEEDNQTPLRDLPLSDLQEN